MSTDAVTPDFDTMSSEDLEAFISQAQTVEPLESDEAEPVQDEVVEEPVQAEETAPAITPEAVDPLQQKSKAEILEMLREQQKFISRQGNDLGKIRKELEQLKTPAPKQDILEDLADWDQEQIKTVQTIVERTMQAQTVAQKAAEEARLEKAKQDNQRAYEQLQEDKELFNLVAADLDQAYGKAGADAIYSEGWVASAIGAVVKQKLLSGVSKPATTQDQDLANRRKQASTLGSTKPVTEAKPVKATKDMTANEYLEFAKRTLGLEDRRGKG